jgi:hypothetical protein
MLPDASMSCHAPFCAKGISRGTLPIRTRTGRSEPAGGPGKVGCGPDEVAAMAAAAPTSERKPNRVVKARVMR